MSATPGGDLRAERVDAYESARPDVAEHVPHDARRVLELGCASGALGASLKRRQPVEVVGIEYSEDYARDAGSRIDRVLVGDALAVLRDQGDTLGTFDTLICADVLEHLVDPWLVLREAVSHLEAGGTAVVSLPNIRSWEVVRELLVRGRWPRRPAGLWDATHLRWFALDDARELLEQAGLTVVAVHPQNWFAGWQRRVVDVLARLGLRAFFTGQYVLVGQKRS
jgi:methionine biosynthesis protein MetW